MRRAQRDHAPNSGRSRGSTSDTSSVFGRYLRDVGQHGLLSADAEVLIARRLADAERGLWALLLDSRVRAVVVAVIERELETVPAALAPGRRNKARDSAAAEAMRIADVDRVAARAAMVMIDELSALAGAAWAEEARAAHAAVVSARNDFAAANLRLVVKIAMEASSGQRALDDLVQDGNLGLLKAIDRFDPGRGVRFATYAAWWIRHALGRSLAQHGRQVRVPISVLRAARRLDSAAKASQDGASIDELAGVAALRTTRAAEVQEAMAARAVSLDSAAADGRTLGEQLAAELPGPGDDLARRQTVARLNALVDSLQPLEQEILRRRFGLDGRDEDTLAVIGADHQLSRERIRQLEVQALSKLRAAMNADERPRATAA